MADRARRAAAAVHGATRAGRRSADLGHGHRQPGPDRRRLSRGVPDEPGRQQAPDPGRRARPADVRRHRAAAGRDARTGRSPAATILPSTAWHAEFEDVNNDGFMDLFVAKGNVEAQPDYAMKDPSNLLIGQADGTFVEGAEAAGHRSTSRGPRRGAGRPQPRRPARPRRGQPARERPALAERRVRDGGTPRRDGPLARRSDSQQPAPNRDAIGAWVEVRVGDRITSAS